MGSKSASGSLVKSVESVLPKGVNIKHVLLAVLVGLLLCMMFGNSIESMTNLTGQQNASSGNGVCRSTSVGGTTCVPDKWVSGTDTPTNLKATPSVYDNLNATQKSALINICQNPGVSRDCNNASNEDGVASDATRSIITSRVTSYDAGAALSLIHI